jgi:hypothetical protein
VDVVDPIEHGDLLSPYRTNIPVDLTASEARTDDGQFHLRCDRATAAQRLRMLADLGFDDAVLVTRRFADADLATLRELV